MIAIVRQKLLAAVTGAAALPIAARAPAGGDAGDRVSQ
jgi:hypothetical protein